MPFHISRLEHSLAVVCGTQPREIVIDSRVLKSCVLKSLPAIASTDCGLLTICVQQTLQGELLSEALFTPKTAASLTEPPSTPLLVDLQEYPRPMPSAKYCKWTLDRQPIEAARDARCAETILIRSVEGDVSLLEGLTSNIAVIEDGVLVTACEGVLRGSMMDLVLRICEEERVPVVRTAPLLSRAAHWSSAFLTSTVCLLVVDRDS
jgi:branched-subunit amino acid aminotransferase/4-amino-4-deoxychorismate lyase